MAGRIDGRGRSGLGKGSLENAQAGEAFPGLCIRLSCTERGQYTLRLGLLSTPTLRQDALGGRFLKDLQDDGHQFDQDARQHASRQPYGLRLLERLLKCLRVLLSTGNALKRLLNLLEALLTGLRLLAALLSLWHDCSPIASVPSVPRRHHAGLPTSYSSPLTG